MLMKSKNVRQLELSDPRWVWTFWYGQNKRSMKILQIAKIQGYHLVQLFLLSPKMVSVQSYGQRRPTYGHLKFGHLDIKKTCPIMDFLRSRNIRIFYWIRKSLSAETVSSPWCPKWPQKCPNKISDIKPCTIELKLCTPLGNPILMGVIEVGYFDPSIGSEDNDGFDKKVEIWSRSRALRIGGLWFSDSAENSDISRDKKFANRSIFGRLIHISLVLPLKHDN